jgi:glycosyltransferase involved in cell wall biosynthesis
MAKIKVALCITELDLGGAERCLAELAVRVDRRRFAPIVYCLGPRPTRDEASCLPPLEAAGVEVHCLGGQGIWQFPLVVRRLKRLLAAQNPQVVQTFLFHANIVGRMAARHAGVKAVVSGIRVAERGSRWHLWLDRLTQGRVDRYVCVSRSVAEFSATRGGLSPAKLVVIPNGIDLEKYPARQPADLAALGVRPGRRIVAFVGRLEPQKGVRWLIETSPEWLTALPDCDLLLVGEGPLQHSLEAVCRAAGIAERVHFAGWRTDVPEILATSDLLVLPSAWEGMPNVVLEAMASGRPVVVSDVEGVRELLGPAAPEQTIRHGDTQDLIGKVVSFMRKPAVAAATGQQNRRWAEENFAISRMVAAYEHLWESLAAD